MTNDAERRHEYTHVEVRKLWKTWSDTISNPSRTYGDYRTNEDKGVHHTYKTRGGKKGQLVHSLAPALT